MFGRKQELNKPSNGSCGTANARKQISSSLLDDFSPLNAYLRSATMVDEAQSENSDKMIINRRGSMIAMQISSMIQLITGENYHGLSESLQLQLHLFIQLFIQLFIVSCVHSRQ